MRAFDEVSYGDYYEPGPVYAPAPSYPYYDLELSPDLGPVYLSDPYVATPDPYEQYMTPPWSPVGLPDQAPKVSMRGPSASVQPRAALTPGIPAGSLFASRYGFGGSRSYQSRASRVPAQRGFTVELQERLRRRRRGRFFG